MRGPKNIMACKFDSGSDYTIRDFFSGNNKIIIPDLQRDYCWGISEYDKENLVRVFFNSIYGLYKKRKEKELYNLGLIYAYEFPETYFQFCDGQQRITTIFLLLGLLNKYTNGKYTNLLVSEKELAGSKNPYLQYSIRETSLAFLYDLVNKFFIENKELKVKDIKNQFWYFREYDYDPTVISILNALTVLESCLEDKKEDTNFLKLGNFISEQLAFLYYDTKDRRNGEETFVVINTTGEALSSTENLKPLLISYQPEKEQSACSEEWEKWDYYFWQHRNPKNSDTSDNGLKEFFRWVVLLSIEPDSAEFKVIEDSGHYDFDVSKYSFNDLKDYFTIIDFLFKKDWYDEKLLSPDEDGNTLIDWFKLLPVMLFIKRFGFDDERAILRIFKFVTHLAAIDNVSKAVLTLLPNILKTIKLLPNKDICSILNIPDVSEQILTAEEKTKLNLFKNAKNRTELENNFWRVEEKPLWKSEINLLLKWSTDNNVFDLSKFKSFDLAFDNLFNIDHDYFRRLALKEIDGDIFPFTKGRNYSFCYGYDDWHNLIVENEKDIKRIIKHFINKNTDESKLKAKELLEKEIDSINSGISKKYKYSLENFIVFPELLELCEHKNLRWDDEDLGTWLIIPKEKATSYMILENAIILSKLKAYNLPDGWYTWFHNVPDESCSVIEKNGVAVIDVHYDGNGKYHLELFTRDGTPKESKIKIEQVSKKLSGTLTGSRYFFNDLTDTKNSKVVRKIREIIKEIDSVQ